MDDVLGDETFRRCHILPRELCEDRTWFPSHPTRALSQESNPEVFRLVEEEEDENKQPELTLDHCYKLIIAPVAVLLKEPEIIIVPDRSLYKVPFSALKDESAKFLSESFRIRIIPSLSTLKLIQDSPEDYHSHNGALIVGAPELGQVLYKGRLEGKSPLPCAREEAERIGLLLRTQPLLGR